MNSANTRMNYIDHAKALGIIFICLGHFLPSGYWLKVLLYSFHVPIFTYISGILFKTPKTYMACLKKVLSLLKRIVLPYTVWHVISSLILFSMIPWDFPRFIKSYFFLENKTIWNDALWYLPSFFIISTIFIFFCRLIKGNRIICAVVSLFAFVTFSILNITNTVITVFGYQNFLGAKNLVLLFAFYCLGFSSTPIISKIIHFNPNAKKNVFIYASITIFFICCAVSIHFNNNDPITLLYGDYNDTIRFVILAIIMSVTFILSCAILPQNNVMALLSANSLFIMSSHYIFINYWLWAKLSILQHTAFTGASLAANVLLTYTLFLLLLQKVFKNHKKLASPLKVFGINMI